ncbi:MAG TPA: hypothetical protein VEU94_06070, partial [Terriglobales bacterium]|nr:hypothetical protein [Terriglobales bacterium]
MTEPAIPAEPGESVRTAAPSDNPNSGSKRARRWLTLSTTREERFFLMLAVFIGLFSGLAVVCFRVAID